jgi:MFS family permease
MQFAYIHYDLKLDLATIGRMNGWGSAFTVTLGLLLGFSFGTLTDRLKPVRMMAPIYAIWGLVKIAGFFFVHDQWTYLGWYGLNGVCGFAVGVAQAAVVIEVFPREKLGQFCSANAITQQLICNGVAILAAKFFDHLQNNRYSFLWQAVFLFIGAMAFLKVQKNWKLRHGRMPVPHAG